MTGVILDKKVTMRVKHLDRGFYRTPVQVLYSRCNFLGIALELQNMVKVSNKMKSVLQPTYMKMLLCMSLLGEEEILEEERVEPTEMQGCPIYGKIRFLRQLCIIGYGCDYV